MAYATFALPIAVYVLDVSLSRKYFGHVQKF